MHRNVVFLLLDSVRRDLAFEEMSRLYDRADFAVPCRAASTWSVPAHGSLLTGRLPHQHGVHADNFDYTTLDRTFLDDLDHRTFGVSANSYASSTFGFDTHFDEFADVRPSRYFTDALDVNEWLGANTPLWKAIATDDWPLRSIANVGYLGLKHLTQSLPMPGLIDEGMQRQISLLRETVEDEPFVVFANVMEAHRPMFQHVRLDAKVAPYRWSSRSVGKWDINTSDDPEAVYGSYLDTYRALYRASLRYMDRYLDALVSDVQEATDRETTVIVTADHGEGLAFPEDGGIIDHTGIFTDSVLNVPLLLFDPPEWFDPEFVSHLDLPGVITAIANGGTYSIDRKWAPSETIGAMGTPDENSSWWDRTSRSLWNPDRAYVWDTASDTDPPEITQEYFDVPIESCRSEVSHDFDDATRTQLENLGYL